LGGGWSLRGVHPKKYTCLPEKKHPPVCDDDDEKSHNLDLDSTQAGNVFFELQMKKI
jgi:hypothetical protein